MRGMHPSVRRSAQTRPRTIHGFILIKNCLPCLVFIFFVSASNVALALSPARRPDATPGLDFIASKQCEKFVALVEELENDSKAQHWISNWIYFLTQRRDLDTQLRCLTGLSKSMITQFLLAPTPIGDEQARLVLLQAWYQQGGELATV
jgi:hypothetical protein